MLNPNPPPPASEISRLVAASQLPTRTTAAAITAARLTSTSAFSTPVFRPVFSPSAPHTASNNSLFLFTFTAKAKPRSTPGLLRLRQLALEVIRNANGRSRDDLISVGIEDIPRHAESRGLH